MREITNIRPTNIGLRVKTYLTYIEDLWDADGDIWVAGWAERVSCWK